MTMRRQERKQGKNGYPLAVSEQPGDDQLQIERMQRKAACWIASRAA